MPAADTRRRTIGIELHLRYSLATLGYMAGIFLLSSIPDQGGTDHGVVVRTVFNLLHIPLYAGLAYFFVRAVAGGKADGTLRWGPYWVTLLGTAAYAVSDEWHQSFVPGRYATVTDVLLDLVGILGILFLLQLRSWREACSWVSSTSWAPAPTS